ncbi:hypothetical protein [Segatella copri]|uniref:Uncharacterized protein n=1 Tax=Segatella copri TaxID=165179 RepID=A0AA93BH34_9BACT|nr:hypothetical protein [Segatella copri]RGW82422.1 hypothetical protein DWV53_01470 [Segatella copri]
MKVFNSKLAAIGLAAFVFASCSDSNSDPTGGSPAINPAEITNITLKSQTVDNSRVINYKNSTAKARKFFLNTRAGSSIFPAFKDAPKEENAKQLNKEADLTNKNYAITGNKSLNFAGKTIDGATIFVHGGSTFEYDNTTKMTNTTIVLLSSATLKYTGTGEMIAKGNTVFCTDAKNKFVATGDININGELYANFTGTTNDGKNLVTGLGAIKETTAAEKEKSITPTQKITFGAHANAYIKGSIRATELNIENGASIYTTSNIFNNGTVNIKSQLGIEGFLKAQNLNVDGYLEAGKNSAIKVLGTMNVNDGAYISANYINVTNNPKNADGSQQKDENGKTIPGNATLNLNGNCTIHLSNKNVINVNNLVTDNSNQGQIELAEDNAVAVIKADKFENNGKERILSFKTSGNNSCFLFQFTKCFNGSTELNTFEDLAIQATYIDYDKTTQNDMVDYKDENNKNYGYEWKGDASKLVATQKLDLIASAEDPKDGESATCIQPANNKLYVSYHTNGNNKVGGSIEVASMTEGSKTLTIEQSKKADNIDYNHLIVKGDKLFLAGSQQGNGKDVEGGHSVGAFMGEVAITGSGISDNLILHSVDKKSDKVDANCVAAYGTDHVLATTQGFYVIDKDDNAELYLQGTVAKHVISNGTKIYALTETGSLNVYNSSDMTTPEKTYTVGAVAPKGNKAVIAIDEPNGDIYVCKGKNGVAKISGNTVTDFFTCPTISSGDKQGQTEGNANGVAVDGKYVYIACGSYGVVVLDKTTGKEVCHRKASNGKSANYVAVADGNIYVAYGQSRIQVYKLTQTN